jgi:hypothetical protein
MSHRAKFLENGLQSSFLMAIGHDAMISGGHQSHLFLSPIGLDKPVVLILAPQRGLWPGLQRQADVV